MAADKLEQAGAILRAYWGTTGPDSTLRQADLRALKPGRKDAEALLDGLPPRGGAGTTGERIGECYRFLESLSSGGLFSK